MSRPTLNYIIELAQEAGRLINEASKKAKKIEQKASASDLVTETDKSVEQFLMGRIREKFPTHKFYCEESEHSELTDEPTWIIDPIDGTMNFVHGHQDHSVSIAFAKMKNPMFGVVYLPAKDEMFAAERGKGATLNGQKIRVADKTRKLKDSLVATGFLVGYLHSNSPKEKRAAMRDVMIKNFTALLDTTVDIRRSGGAAADLTSVACGRIDAYAEIGIHAWDFAAGQVIVEEAGGVVTTYDGRKTAPLNTRHLIAASGQFLAQELASVLTCAPLNDSEF